MTSRYSFAKTTGIRAAVWFVWGLAGLCAVLNVSGLVLFALMGSAPGATDNGNLLADTILSIAFTVVGALIIWRRRENHIAWVFIVVGIGLGASVFTNEYVAYALLGSSDASLALSGVALGGSLAGFVGFLSLPFIPLLFPDGKLLSSRWRPLVWLTGSVTALTTIGVAVMPGHIEGLPVMNPLGIESAAEFLKPATPVLQGAFFVSFLGAIASLIFRFFRSRGAERQQLKWFAYGSIVLVISFVFNDIFPGVSWAIGAAGAAFMPFVLGLAILRYRLYDIDLIVNRTLVYGILTVCVIGIYVLVVGELGALLQAHNNLFISLLATGAVAMLFAPLRERLQRGINRLMYGERDDPYTVLSRLGERLKATDAPGTVLPAIVETVAQALKLPHAAIALMRDDGGFETVAARGYPKGESLVLPLSYGTETIGKLVLSPRAPGEPFGPADRRLLDDLSRHAEAAAYAMRLTADLQRSRERLVNARKEERRRLRRDLHDGLGPQLATLTLKLDAARNLLAQEPRAADALLAGLKAQVQAAISDIRRLVYALRPPALDELGLIPALHEQATNYR